MGASVRLKKPGEDSRQENRWQTRTDLRWKCPSAAAVTTCMSHTGRTSGRDQPQIPERLRRFIANAPYDGLKRSADD